MHDSTLDPVKQELNIRSTVRSPWSHPLAVFDALRRSGPYPVIFWKSPEGENIIAAGTARSFGADEHADWRAEFAAGFEEARNCIDDPNTRLLCSVYFDPEGGQPAAWAAYPPLQLLLPRLLCVSGAHGSTLQLASASHDDDTMEQLLRKLDDEDRDPAFPPQDPLSAYLEWNEVPFQIAVEQAVRNIRRGLMSKAVLARSVSVKAERDINVHRMMSTLDELYPRCHLYAQAPDSEECFVSSTPERMVEVRNGALRTAALAGSAPTGRTLVEEQQNRRTLQTNSKLWREHSMVAEMIHGALESISDEVILAVPEIVRLRNVQHLSTPITARLKADKGFVDALLALHPTPAVCGTPQAAAMELIRRLEQEPRGLYAGVAGWLDLAGNGDAAVMIRSGRILRREAQLFAGAGIVSESVVKQELDETRVKLQAMLSALAVS